MFHIHSEEVTTFFSTGALWTALSYAIATIPPVSNPWASWAIGVLQFSFANKEKGKAAMQHAAGQVLQAKGQETVRENKEAEKKENE